MEGEKIYSAAILLVDKYNKRFKDMLAHDSVCSEIEREYLIDEFSWLPAMGWQEFSEAMVSENQSAWLTKICQLDENVLLDVMERRLLETLEGQLLDDGRRVIDKDGLDGCVKAIQGLVGRSKILSEQRGAQIANNEIILKIVQSKTDEEVGGDCEKIAREGSNGGRP